MATKPAQTRDSSFSAKSSRHFESRSSLHVSDLAALTIIIILLTFYIVSSVLSM